MSIYCFIFKRGINTSGKSNYRFSYNCFFFSSLFYEFTNFFFLLWHCFIDSSYSIFLYLLTLFLITLKRYSFFFHLLIIALSNSIFFSIEGSEIPSFYLSKISNLNSTEHLCLNLFKSILFSFNCFSFDSIFNKR